MRLALVVTLAFGVGCFAATSARAALYTVPSDPTPTVQAAVAAAAGNNDPENVIQLAQSPHFTSARVLIGVEFNSKHRLLIRPVPGLGPHGRAIVASQNGSQPIFDLAGCGSVTIQDLEILRYATNNADLVAMDHPTDVVLERCRIGSVWSSVGSALKSNISVGYPVNVTVRNCILFSAVYGNFDYGLHAIFGDGTNSLFLYNNTIADYATYGTSDRNPGDGASARAGREDPPQTCREAQVRRLSASFDRGRAAPRCPS